MAEGPKDYESRELTALRAEAEQRLERDNESRVHELKKVLNNLDEQKITEQQILDYLNGCEPEVLEPELLECGEFGHILDMVSKDEKIFSIPNPLGWKYGFVAVMHPPTSVGLDTNILDKVDYYPVFWKDEIAKLRSVALLYRHFQGQEPREIIAQRLPFHTAEYLSLVGHDIPPWLLLRLPQDYRDEIKRNKDETDQIIERLVEKYHGLKWNEEIDERATKERAEERAKGIQSTGMHPQIYDRQKKVELEQIMTALKDRPDKDRPDEEEVFKRIFDAYPDIRVLVDKILALKDGKLPI